jgi:hypothetical protein
MIVKPLIAREWPLRNQHIPGLYGSDESKAEKVTQDDANHEG